MQCHIDMIIYDCHIPTMKVEPVMLDTSQCHIDSCSMSHRPVMSDTLVQCHIEMIIYDFHIPTMKAEPVMLDTSQLCNVGYSCPMSHRL